MNNISKEIDEANISLLSDSILQSTPLINDDATAFNENLNFYSFVNSQSNQDLQYPVSDNTNILLLDQADNSNQIPKDFNYVDTGQSVSEAVNCNQTENQPNLNLINQNDVFRPKLNENNPNYYHNYNHWNHFYYHNPWAYCPQFCQTHRMQFYPYYAYLRCYGPIHFQNQYNYLPYGDLIHQFAYTRRKKESNLHQDSKDNFADTMLNTEKTSTSTSVETLEPSEQIEDSHIPYITEYELEVHNSCQQESELYKSRLQKKKRGRRSKKDVI